MNKVQEILKIQNKTESKENDEEINYYNAILEVIEDVFSSDNYNTSNLDNGKDEIIETNKMIITFTTIENQKNKQDDNVTTIDLGECE